MKLRKVFAGIAAAATMLGGLALGATTANAAEVDSTATGSITLSGATAANTTYTAYKIGSYTGVEGADGNATSVTVTTDDPWKGAAVDVLGTDITGSAEYKAYGDPLAYVAGTSLYSSANSSELSAFVEGLAAKIGTEGFDVTVAGSVDVKNNNDLVTFENLAQGLYLVVATQTGSAPVASAGKALAIIGTKIADKDGDDYGKLNDYELGKAGVKPTTPQKPGKSHELLGGGYVGTQVKYTLTGTVPEYIAGDGEFKFIDTPGKGLTVNAVKDSFTVTDKDGNNVEFSVSVPDGQVTNFKGDGSKSFTIAISNPTNYKGQQITVVYNATINEEASTKDGVPNTVELGNNSTTDTIPGKNINFNTVSFTKKGVDEDEDGLKDVVFSVAAADTNEVKVNVADVTSGENGVVTISNLPNGTYTVTEKTPATGYLTTNLPSFTFTVENGKITSFIGDTWGLATATGGADKGYSNITVKNVKKITQLPLTGAAGTALFTLVGVLLAGAAVTVFAKSRSTKRALTA